jgi:hypothetical protein
MVVFRVVHMWWFILPVLKDGRLQTSDF